MGLQRGNSQYARKRGLPTRETSEANCVARGATIAVPMLAGTDCGANNNHMIPGWSLHEELEELVKIGLSPADVLRMATWKAAEWRNRTASEGSIDHGKFADLVLLRNDPLQDIRHTREIEAVFVSGKYHTRQDLDAMLSRAKAAAKETSY